MWLRLLLAGSFLIGLAESEYTCRYSDEISIHKDGTTFMQQYVNEDEGTFTMRLRYTGGQSWIGIGINTIGKNDMAPAEAVIGDINRGVKRYSLQSDDKQGSGVIPLQDINNHLKSSSFLQTEAGESILEFTQDLVIRNPGDGSIIHEISELSVWIWAVGLPDNAWAGKHKLHGAFEGFELYSGCVKSTTQPTPNPTAPPVAAPTQKPTSPPNQMQSFEPNDSMYSIYPEDSFNNETGFENEFVDYFGNETLAGQETNSSEGDEGDLMSDASNALSNTIGTSELSFIESTSEATRGLWVAHGILMGVAWGILVPLAIGAAYLRNNLTILKKDALWLRIHFYLGGLAALFTVVGFVLAVVATQKDDDLPHFEEDTHHKAGLAIFILVLVQALAGYLRPSPIPAPLPTNEHILDIAAEGSPEGSEENLADVKVVDKMDTGTTTSMTLYIRKFWEYTHRLLGIVLLGLAWYNCHSGIVLQAENYDQDDEESMIKIFWSITGCITGSIVFVGYVMRVSPDQ